MADDIKKGDVLVGKDGSFKGAYHPIIYIDGPRNAPLAVVLTHSNDFPCNVKLLGNYGVGVSYFIAHLIEKASEWGPYEKVDELTTEDMDFIETHIQGQIPITYEQYEKYTEQGCPDHA